MSLTSRGTGSHQRMHKRSLSNCLCLPKNSKAKLKRFPVGSTGEDLNSTGTLGCRRKCLVSLHSGPCCVEYNPGPLPLSRVKNYVPTGSHCSQPAVIFTTIKNKLVCANPNDKWVKDIMNQLKDNRHSG
ncbi:C-C motif chemokine 26 [Zonotrichia albicollis]|uniref:C-C motif chemokine 26 n=1 Tax=Zonotrichia albicollis TaxID=44394 RepID=UPI00039420C8|nr:C-C motif chemokine 26-like [Zonotrichia albicollis]XP_026653069.1 C-C motif chemokine 26-like [Zonotrichia albicollis]XP_026653070.1 C-C motif chemokine 26-like [Zonotrichia albicollis]XP_026653071.1 C-C motif chemokine 26-like [Zonotrichia albicollis]XP_026653072.1 C-C motif chemokine 26-like [Zonotrichia albicollis]